MRYHQIVAEYIAAGKRKDFQPSDTNDPNRYMVTELLAAYWTFATSYYRKNGEPTSEQTATKHALSAFRQVAGDKAVEDIGPRDSKAIQQHCIVLGWCRQNINRHAGRIKRMFKWGVSEELVPADVFHALTTVSPLKKGRTNAHDAAPVLQVSAETIAATIKHLPVVVADMVRFQRLTGCRPGEVRILRPCDVGRTGDVWEYVPSRHKTEHHERRRIN